MPSLVIREKDGPEREHPLRKARTTIGKMPDNDIVLDRTNISRRHCQIFLEGNEFFVRDLASRNGTFLNGQRVEGDRILASGAVIQLGDFSIVFKDAAEPAVPRPGEAAWPAAVPASPRAPVRRAIPTELKKKLHATLIEQLDLKKLEFSQSSDRELRERASMIITAVVERHAAEIPEGLTKGDLVREVLDEALGLGPLEDLLADPEVTEIMVNRWDRIYVEKKGQIQLTGRQFTDNQQVVNIVRRIVSPLGRRIDEASPMVDARLPDGSRVNAVIPPIAITGPAITVRKFSRDPYTVEDLVRFGTLTEPIARFLRMAVENKRNILISGGTGSGKTTLLNVLSGFIPGTERIVTIEDAAELRLAQEHVVSMEARPPNIEGEGAIPIRKLVINALRMRPDRIVVGECRGGEALDMMQAMNTGHEGSLTTLHANTPRDAFSRLETMVLMSGLDLPVRSIRQQVASAIHLVVQIARATDGTRKLMSVSEVTGMEGEVITMQDIFVFEQKGFGSKNEVLGVHKATGTVPKFVHRLRQAGVAVDMGAFA